MNDDTLLSDYAVDVEAFFKKESPAIINNKDKAHAAVLISTLFKKAGSEIVIFTRNFDGDFYSNPAVKNELLSAIVDRGVKVKILVQEPGSSDDLLNELDYYPEVTVQRCEANSLASNSQLNFTVVDRKAYRLEKNRKCHEAFACANDVATSGKILSLFRDFQTMHAKVDMAKNH